MQEYKVPGTYYMLLGIMVTIAVVLLVYFHKKKWLGGFPHLCLH